MGAIKKDKKTAVMSEMEHGTSAWKALNMLRSKAKSANGLLLDGKVETDSLKMATAMNQYFTNKITKLKEEMEKEVGSNSPVAAAAAGCRPRRALYNRCRHFRVL